MTEQLHAKVLALAGSPRRGGNTDMLLEAFLEGARAAGAQTDILYISSLKIAPCDACDGCAADGKCILIDDFQLVSEQMVESDVIVLAAPLYFAALPAQVKCLIDRSQCQWVRKYKLHAELPPSCNGCSRRGGILLSVAGDARANFDGMRRTVRYFFNVFETDYVDELLVSGIDGHGQINKKTLKIALTLGRKSVGITDVR
ncbi:flavodoxin family protein [Candidatus Bipolaricaulota bacterium]|nr:flavodoxin family protein [Candidatus Bipolaricaulota bacterium]